VEYVCTEHQMNGYDCGLFTCLYAEKIIVDKVAIRDISKPACIQNQSSLMATQDHVTRVYRKMFFDRLITYCSHTV